MRRRKGDRASSLRLGVRDGVVWHVDDVPSGLACGCTCAGCGERLIAKRGEKNSYHFAHVNDAECATAAESALHLAAKQALAAHRRMKVPPAHAYFNSGRRSVLVEPGRMIEFTCVSLEVPISELIVDALGVDEAGKVAVEIRVTHAVDAPKRDQLARLGLTTIEIDLSDTPRDLTLPEIAKVVVDGALEKQWVHHQGAEEARRAAIAAGTTYETIERGNARHVDWCPREHWQFKGMPYANVAIHCAECPDALEISPAREVVICAARPLTGGSFNGSQHELFPTGSS